MVSYYNHFAMYPKNHSGNLPYTASSGWYPGNYQHQPPHPQFIGDGESSPQPMYYPHPHVFHQSSPDWSGHENFSTPPQTTLLPHGPSPGGLHLGGGGGGGQGGGAGGAGSGGNPAGHNSSSSNNNNNASDHLGDGLHSIPSPPITVSGSDMSSPGAPNGSSSPQISSRPTPVKSPFEWMKKQSYQSQPNPGLINICSAPSLQDFTPVESAVSSDLETLESTEPFDEEPLKQPTESTEKEIFDSLILSSDRQTLKSVESPDKETCKPTVTIAGVPMKFGINSDEPFTLRWPIEAFSVPPKPAPRNYPINYEKPGKTRTKDKYRVVYTDQQRLELEKEFHYTRYITIRRKSELAQSLQLSERQVKIWFQNRRAKDRKQKKKAENGTVGPVSLNGQSLGSVHSQHHPHHAHHHGGQSMSSLLGDTKPKLEPSLHLSHLHPMSAMSMGMGSMGLHPAHHPLHSHLGVPTSQHLNQGPGSQVPPASLSIM